MPRRRDNIRIDNKALKRAVMELVNITTPNEFIRELSNIVGERNERGVAVEFLYMPRIDKNKKAKVPWTRRYGTDTPETGNMEFYIFGYNLIYAPSKSLKAKKAKFLISVINEHCDLDCTKIRV